MFGPYCALLLALLLRTTPAVRRKQCCAGPEREQRGWLRNYLRWNLNRELSSRVRRIDEPDSFELGEQL